MQLIVVGSVLVVAISWCRMSSAIGGRRNPFVTVKWRASMMTDEIWHSVSSLREVLISRVSAPTSSSCHCRRSFHLFCTDLFDEKEAASDVTQVHPAPHCRDRDSTRRLPMLHRKCTYSMAEETHENRNRTGDPDRWLLTNAMTHTVGRKVGRRI